MITFVLWIVDCYCSLCLWILWWIYSMTFTVKLFNVLFPKRNAMMEIFQDDSHGILKKKKHIKLERRLVHSRVLFNLMSRNRSVRWSLLIVKWITFRNQRCHYRMVVILSCTKILSTTNVKGNDFPSLIFFNSKVVWSGSSSAKFFAQYFQSGNTDRAWNVIPSFSKNNIKIYNIHISIMFIIIGLRKIVSVNVSFRSVEKVLLFRWDPEVPRRVCFFFWLILHPGLLTIIVLLRDARFSH